VTTPQPAGVDRRCRRLVSKSWIQAGKVTRADFVTQFHSFAAAEHASSRLGIEACSAMTGVQHSDREIKLTNLVDTDHFSVNLLTS
jgi:hypothetical protein